MLRTESSGGGAVCNFSGLAMVCATNPIPEDEEDISVICANACMQAILPCTDNPMLTIMMGPEEAEGLASLNDICEPPEGGSGPGDGVCELQSILTMADDSGIDSCGEDIVCMCNDPT